jgi:putative tricarboxylic transport membrane protein
LATDTEATARGDSTAGRSPASETLVGVALAGLGGAMVLQSRSLPTVAHIEFGPGLFPTIVGGLMLLLGLALAIRSRIVRPAADSGPPDAFLHPPRPGLLVAYLAAPALYIVVAPKLGFLLTITLLFAGLAWLAAGRPLRAIAAGIAMAFLIHIVFVGLMRVSLPYGIIEQLIGGLHWP